MTSYEVSMNKKLTLGQMLSVDIHSLQEQIVYRWKHQSVSTSGNVVNYCIVLSYKYIHIMFQQSLGYVKLILKNLIAIQVWQCTHIDVSWMYEFQQEVRLEVDGVPCVYPYTENLVHWNRYNKIVNIQLYNNKQ